MASMHIVVSKPVSKREPYHVTVLRRSSHGDQSCVLKRPLATSPGLQAAVSTSRALSKCCVR